MLVKGPGIANDSMMPKWHEKADEAMDVSN